MFEKLLPFLFVLFLGLTALSCFCIYKALTQVVKLDSERLKQLDRISEHIQQLEQAEKTLSEINETLNQQLTVQERAYQQSLARRD